MVMAGGATMAVPNWIIAVSWTSCARNAFISISMPGNGLGWVARNLCHHLQPFEYVSGVTVMKAREAALKLKKFDAEEKARKVDDLEQMIRDFEQMAGDLDIQIQAEEDRTGIRDRNHFAYSTFARSAVQRRQNLQTSIDDLRARLDAAVAERDEALSEIEDADLAQPRTPSSSLRSTSAYVR